MIIIFLRFILCINFWENMKKYEIKQLTLKIQVSYYCLVKEVEEVKSMNLNEVLDLLKREGITSHIDSVRRWIRNGKLKATLLSKKEGYRVKKEDLLEFIKTKLPQKRYEEVKLELLGGNQGVELPEEMFMKAEAIITGKAFSQVLEDFELTMDDLIQDRKIKDDEKYKALLNLSVEIKKEVMKGLSPKQLQAMVEEVRLERELARSELEVERIRIEAQKEIIKELENRARILSQIDESKKQYEQSLKDQYDRLGLFKKEE